MSPSTNARHTTIDATDLERLRARLSRPLPHPDAEALREFSARTVDWILRHLATRLADAPLFVLLAGRDDVPSSAAMALVRSTLGGTVRPDVRLPPLPVGVVAELASFATGGLTVDVATAVVVWPPLRGLRPSQEMPVHLGIYRAVPEARCVVHTHPPDLVAQSRARDAIRSRPRASRRVSLGQSTGILDRSETQVAPPARGTSMELELQNRVAIVTGASSCPSGSPI